MFTYFHELVFRDKMYDEMVGMAMGRGGDGFCLLHPHLLLAYTYMLPEIESHPRPQWVLVYPPYPRPRSESIFFNINGVFF